MSADESKKEHELFEQRLKDAELWKTLGHNPFGNGFTPRDLAGELQARFRDSTAEQLEQVKDVFSLAGRVVLMRSFGKMTFLTLQDRSGRVQLLLKKDVLGDAFEATKPVGLGDFVGAEGTVIRTKTGELTLATSRFIPLTKALRAPPDKFHGLSDQELRYRQRYLDLMSSDEVREVFRKRTRLVQFIRRFLDARGYLEVETPMMHPLVSGAAARPFITHHNTLDMKLFMRIAPELYLKRLLVGGFDRVYEINRNFRNEGISTRHNPEFTMLEFYQSYATYEDLMDMTEEMISEACIAVTGSAEVTYGEVKLNFGRGWKRVAMQDAIREKVPTLSAADMGDVHRLRVEALKGLRPEERGPVEKMNRGELIGFLFERHVEESLMQPTFVTHFPTEISPLARRNDKDPTITDRFELFCCGREIANAFSELNDPIDQKQRFLGQVEAKNRGQDETMDYDEDYIRALEHGMPPAAGEGIGIDRLAMLFTNAPSIRDVILFPLLKPTAA